MSDTASRDDKADCWSGKHLSGSPAANTGPESDSTRTGVDTRQ